MTGEPPPRPAGGPLAALALGAPPAVAAARLVAGAWLARAGLELAGGAHGLEGPVGRPLEALALACALPLLVGLALSRSLRRASGPARLLITEPVGWAAVAAVGLAVPTALGDGGWRLAAGSATSALLAGLALGGLRAAWRRPWLTVGALIAGAILGVQAGAAAFATSARRWSGPDVLALVLGSARPEDAQLRKAIDAETIRLRTLEPGPPTVAVVDVTSGEETLRLLTVDGVLQGAAPTRLDAPRRVLSASIVAAALPFLVRSEPPQSVDVLGLGTGVPCGIVLAGVGLDGDVRLFEPCDGVIAAHQEVGDPFGFLNGRCLTDARLERLRAPLPGTPQDAVVAVTVAAVPAAARRLRRAETVAWITRSAPSAALRALGNRAVHVFQPTPEAMVLLVGPEHLDLDALQAAWQRATPVVNALKSVGLITPLDLLATAVAGPRTVRAAALRDDEALDGATLAREDAGAVVETLDASGLGDEAAATLAELALTMARRQNPAAVACAEAAVATARTPSTLVAKARVLAAREDAAGAEAAARQAVEAAPDAVEPRLVLGQLLLARKAWEEGRAALLPAAGRNPAHEGDVQLLLGKLALGARAPGLAIRHLKAARGHPEAKDLVAVARLIESEQGESATDRLEDTLRAADLLLRRARSEGGSTRRDALDDAIASLLPLSDADDAGMTDDQRGRLGRELRRAAALEEPARRAPLERRAAEVLAPLAGDLRWGRERGEALLAAGEPAGAAAALATLAADAGRDDGDVQRLLGEALLADGKPDAALAPLRRSLTIGPASSLQTRVYLAIAEAERQAGHADRAIEALQTAERLFPGHPRVRINLGTLLLQAGRDGEALRAYRRYLEVAPPRDPLRARVEEAVRKLEAKRGG